MTPTRRHLLHGMALSALWPSTHVCATPEQGQSALADLIKGRTVQTGRVTLDIPPLVENGNSVMTTVTVDSPMSARDHVRAIHLIAEGNPVPRILSAYFTPLSGQAVLTARIRLGDSQRVWALAEMSDASLWLGSADTVVTTSACTEER